MNLASVMLMTCKNGCVVAFCVVVAAWAGCAVDAEMDGSACAEGRCDDDKSGFKNFDMYVLRSSWS